LSVLIGSCKTSCGLFTQKQQRCSWNTSLDHPDYISQSLIQVACLGSRLNVDQGSQAPAGNLDRKGFGPFRPAAHQGASVAGQAHFGGRFGRDTARFGHKISISWLKTVPLLPNESGLWHENFDPSMSLRALTLTIIISDVQRPESCATYHLEIHMTLMYQPDHQKLFSELHCRKLMIQSLH
jgi:hypothetical protein